MILTEHQIKFVADDLDVRLKLYSDPGRVYEGKIEHVGETEYSIGRQDYEPDQQKMMQQGGGQPRDRISEMVAVYQHRDLQYYARVPLEDTQGTLRIGTGGQARIYVDNRSLGYRLWWWINQNFRS